MAETSKVGQLFVLNPFERKTRDLNSCRQRGRFLVEFIKYSLCAGVLSAPLKYVFPLVVLGNDFRVG